MAAALTPPTAQQKPAARPARNRLERIRGLSRWMRGLLIAAAVLLVAAMIGMWFFTSEAVLARAIYSFLGVTPSPQAAESDALRIGLAPTLNAPRLQLGFGYRVLGFALFGVLAGLALRGIAHAAIDISDGLLQDLGHILAASRVGAVLHEDRMPVAAALAGMPAEQVRRAVLGGGDVYQLCFTAPADRRDAVRAAAQAAGARVTQVGSIVAQSGLSVLDAAGQPLARLPAGFDHFPAA